MSDQNRLANAVVAGRAAEKELPDSGDRVREALGRSLGLAQAFITNRRRSRVKTAAAASCHPEKALVLEYAQNAKTWAALQRLGVQEGTEISLDFFFETAGPDADGELAEFLRSVGGYHVVVEPDGVSGRTRPMAMSAMALDAWVRAMLYAGLEHGRCLFAGWTATLSR
jgi:hypothetical protein